MSEPEADWGGSIRRAVFAEAVILRFCLGPRHIMVHLTLRRTCSDKWVCGGKGAMKCSGVALKGLGSTIGLSFPRFGGEGPEMKQTSACDY